MLAEDLPMLKCSFRSNVFFSQIECFCVKVILAYLDTLYKVKYCVLSEPQE